MLYICIYLWLALPTNIKPFRYRLKSQPYRGGDGGDLLSGRTDSTTSRSAVSGLLQTQNMAALQPKHHFDIWEPLEIKHTYNIHHVWGNTSPVHNTFQHRTHRHAIYPAHRDMNKTPRKRHHSSNWWNIMTHPLRDPWTLTNIARSGHTRAHKHNTIMIYGLKSTEHGPRTAGGGENLANREAQYTSTSRNVYVATLYT